jgi:hypothetical protein
VLWTKGALKGLGSPILLAYALAFGAWWHACVLGRRPLTARAVLWVGLALRLGLLPMPVEDDMARYIWEGRVLAAGHNPYRLAPDAEALQDLRDGMYWGRINHRDVPAIYPPPALAVFAVLAAPGGTGYAAAYVFKAAFILGDIAAFLLLLRLLRRREEADRDRIAAIYFLNPLLLLEIAGLGHFDGLLLPCLVAFLLALEEGRPGRAALFLFLGASLKIAALALLPVLVLRGPRPRAAAYAALLLAALAAELALSGALGNLGRFATDFRYNAAFPYLIHLLGSPFLGAGGERALGLALFLVSVFAAAFRLRAAAAERQALVFMGLFLLFSPTLHPWYVLWILPFAALCQSRPWLLLTGTAALSYVVYIRAAFTGRLREIPWLRLPEFLPPLLLWLIPKLKSRPASA